MSAWIFRMCAPMNRTARIFRFVRKEVYLHGYSECVRQTVGLHGFSECVRQGVGQRGYSESLVYFTTYFAVSDVCHRTYKSIIRKGLSNADVTTLIYSSFVCISLNKHNINASLQ